MESEFLEVEIEKRDAEKYGVDVRDEAEFVAGEDEEVSYE